MKEPSPGSGMLDTRVWKISVLQVNSGFRWWQEKIFNRIESLREWFVNGHAIRGMMGR